VVNQAIWFEGETKFADIILPACTNFERFDISEGATARATSRIRICSPPPSHCVPAEVHRAAGDSKSDYAIFEGLAERLGVWGPFTMGGKTELDWVKGLLQRHRHAQGP